MNSTLTDSHLSDFKHLVVCDIDNTLISDREAAHALGAVLKAYKREIGFAIATGRNLEAALAVLRLYDYPHPELLITSAGSEIYYGGQEFSDRHWAAYIDHGWKPDSVREALHDIGQIELQTNEGAQRKYKISYTVKEGTDTALLLQCIKEALQRNTGRQHIIVSHGLYLDILPYRGGKGNAIEYLVSTGRIERRQIITAGDSENDRDMFTKGFRSIIVANHEKSLDSLYKTKNRFFASKKEAAGVLEGLRHFGVVQ